MKICKLVTTGLVFLLLNLILMGCDDNGPNSAGRQADSLRKVEIRSGMIKGTARDGYGIIAFKGIPYAQPPVGELRWREPRPVKPWGGVLKTQAFGAPCVAAFRDNPAESEDCLTLNVWTGAESSDEKRPVMVWIHGGGFVFGSSARTNGRVLARKGVVVVSMNYRLGVFGFMANPWPNADNSVSTNAGLEDMIAALEWVHENISAFGGDPENITVFGESAGAHAIGLLMASPDAKGLFHKAILESGAFWGSEHGSMSTLVEARVRSRELANDLGVNSMSALRDVPAQKLKAATLWNPTTDPGITVFTPHVDGDVVPAVPAKRFTEGKQMNIPIIAGWNAQEELPIFVPRALPHDTVAEFKAAAQVMFGDRTGEFLALYPANTVAQATASARDLIGGLVISQQTWEAADSQRRVWNVPVYVYNFTYTSDYSPVAMHASEIPFVFGTLEGNDPPPSPKDQAMSETIMNYWTNFAKTGDPNGDSVPHWPIYEGAGMSLLQLGNTIKRIENPRQARFEFIRSLRDDGVLPTGWRDIDVDELDIEAP